MRSHDITLPTSPKSWKRFLKRKEISILSTNCCTTEAPRKLLLMTMQQTASPAQEAQSCPTIQEIQSCPTIQEAQKSNP